MNQAQIKELLPFMTDDEKAEISHLLTVNAPIWTPLSGPQTRALESEADIIFYGGAAGGGKTDLEIGLALTEHKKSIIFRKEGTQLQGIYDRLTEILGSRDGFAKMDKIWRLSDRQIEFGAITNKGDEQKYQGRPHDLKCFDELPHFSEAEFRFLCGWLRSTDPNVRCRIIGAGNPPTTSEGEWVKRFWAPWLDADHPDPAADGELRWFAVIDGEDVEMENGDPYEYEYADGKKETITPKSRTFIRSKIQDNPYLMDTGYMATLQALPEPLRSQMLYGSFDAGTEDDAWQVIPTAWVQAAMDRWTDRSPKGPMDSLGADIACGGNDNTVLSPRHGNWFDNLQKHKGIDTPDGAATSALIMAMRRDQAPVHMDVIGWGKDTHTHLVENGIHTIPVNGANKSDERSLAPKGYHPSGADDGSMGFYNFRAQLYWQMREELDPSNDNGICLPPDNRLRAQLCAHRWKLTSRGIQVLSKDDVKELLGESPDSSDAVVMANMKTPKTFEDLGQTQQMDNDFDVFAT
jgi:hypothetical protein